MVHGEHEFVTKMLLGNPWRLHDVEVESVGDEKETESLECFVTFKSTIPMDAIRAAWGEWSNLTVAERMHEINKTVVQKVEGETTTESGWTPRRTDGDGGYTVWDSPSTEG